MADYSDYYRSTPTPAPGANRGFTYAGIGQYTSSDALVHKPCGTLVQQNYWEVHDNLCPYEIVTETKTEVRRKHNA